MMIPPPAAMSTEMPLTAMGNQGCSSCCPEGGGSKAAGPIAWGACVDSASWASGLGGAGLLLAPRWHLELPRQQGTDTGLLGAYPDPSRMILSPTATADTTGSTAAGAVLAAAEGAGVVPRGAFQPGGRDATALGHRLPRCPSVSSL